MPEVRLRLDDAVSATEPSARHQGDPALAAAFAGSGPRVAALCAAVVAGALLLDTFDPLRGQIAAGVLTWGVALALIGRTDGMRRRALFYCLVWATAGELFCSLVWGLYTYRLGHIPHFVPPGHVLMFLLGTHLAQRMPAAVADRVTMGVVALTPAAVLLLGDAFSALLFAVYAALYWLEARLRPLLATMFLLTLALELCGTALGVWGWNGRAPVVDLAMTNPPFAVAAFYCTLDALVVWSVRARLANARQAGVAVANRG